MRGTSRAVVVFTMLVLAAVATAADRIEVREAVVVDPSVYYVVPSGIQEGPDGFPLPRDPDPDDFGQRIDEAPPVRVNAEACWQGRVGCNAAVDHVCDAGRLTPEGHGGRLFAHLDENGVCWGSCADLRVVVFCRQQ